jgi:hypothetical protein
MSLSILRGRGKGQLNIGREKAVEMVMGEEILSGMEWCLRGIVLWTIPLRSASVLKRWAEAPVVVNALRGAEARIFHGAAQSCLQGHTSAAEAAIWPA